jgi:hypothetical protein
VLNNLTPANVTYLLCFFQSPGDCAILAFCPIADGAPSHSIITLPLSLCFCALLVAEADRVRPSFASAYLWSVDVLLLLFRFIGRARTAPTRRWCASSSYLTLPSVTPPSKKRRRLGLT